MLRNDLGTRNHWLIVATEDARGHQPVLNARVTVWASGHRWTREVRPHQSYLVTSDPRVHFGLGAADQVQRVVVRWPDGLVEAWHNVPVDRIMTVRHGQGRSVPDEE